jgi:hypothetical protein
MVDLKVYKPVSATFAATAAGAGTFPAPVGVGSPVSLTASTVGVMFTTFASSDGTVILSVIADNAAAPATPVGSMVEGVFVSPLPVYTSGDAAVFHTDARGRLIVALSNPSGSATVDIDTDDSPAPSNPSGIWTLLLYDATLPTYADGDAAAMHADSRGRMLVSLINPTSGNTIDVNTDEDAAPTNPTGIWTLALFDTTLPTYTNGDAAVLHSSVNGELLTLERPPGTSAITSVAAAVASTSLLAANTTRRGAMIFNDSASANLYVKLGSTASLTSFTALVPPSGYYELPYPVYTGTIDGIWDAAVGDARITELTV